MSESDKKAADEQETIQERSAPLAPKASASVAPPPQTPAKTPPPASKPATIPPPATEPFVVPNLKPETVDEAQRASLAAQARVRGRGRGRYALPDASTHPFESIRLTGPARIFVPDGDAVQVAQGEEIELRSEPEDLDAEDPKREDIVAKTRETMAADGGRRRDLLSKYKFTWRRVAAPASESSELAPASA
jgi:hypothetical protein